MTLINFYLVTFSFIYGIHINLSIILLQIESSDFLMFLGRFHPLIVHLPIGFLSIAGVLEYLSRRKKYQDLRHATSLVLFLTSLSSIIAAVLGYFLSLGGGYDEDILFWHKWFGIALAVGSTLAWFLRVQFLKYASPIFAKSYLFFLIISFLFLTGTGHQGGSLTHGSDYLTSYMPDPLRKLSGLPSKKKIARKKITNIQQAVVYSDIIQPILDERCASCHNSSKKKGDLRLDNIKDLLKGGEHGEVFVSGNPLKSHLYSYLLLPEDKDEHMPPKGKTQLTREQISIIGWWIQEGASFEKKVAELKAPDSIKATLAKLGESERGPQGIFAKKVAAADPKKVAALYSSGLRTGPIAVGVNYLQVYIAPDKDTFGLKEADALLTISEQVTWLDLSNKFVAPQALAALSKFPNLSRLHLEKTNIEDEMLKIISTLKNLEYLNLYGTHISDAGLKNIESLKKLQSLYLWQTKATIAEADKLKIKNPGLIINMGQEEKLFLQDSTKEVSKGSKIAGLR